MIAPILLLILLGIIQFGVTTNNYIELVDGVRSGARALAISRSSSTPYTSMTTAITSSAPNLTSSSITTTVTVDGTACTSDSTCETALSTAAGDTATVASTYPCNLVVMSRNFLPGCTLSASTTEMVE